MRFCWASSLVAAALLTAACGSRSEPAPTVKPEASRKAAPEFSLKDDSGRAVHLSDYRGRVVLLNFWATWCGPCKVEIPWFIQFQRAYRDRGLAVLGVSMDEAGWDAVRPYAAGHHINYPVLLSTPEIAQLYAGMTVLPTTYLIDRQGRVERVQFGLPEHDVYQSAIETLLLEP